MALCSKQIQTDDVTQRIEVQVITFIQQLHHSVLPNIKFFNQSINLILSSPNLIKLIYKPPRASIDEYNHYFRLSSLCLIQRFKCRILGIECLHEGFIYLFASCLALFVPFLKILGIIHDLFIYSILLVNEKCITNHKGIDYLKEKCIGQQDRLRIQ